MGGQDQTTRTTFALSIEYENLSKVVTVLCKLPILQDRLRVREALGNWQQPVQSCLLVHGILPYPLYSQLLRYVPVRYVPV